MPWVLSHSPWPITLLLFRDFVSRGGQSYLALSDHSIVIPDRNKAQAANLKEPALIKYGVSIHVEKLTKIYESLI